jgi:hypothetical protein
VNKTIIALIALTLTSPVMAGGDYHKPKPKPPAPVVQTSDDVHHESRSSKLAKIAGVAALIGLTYHLTWGGTPEQNKGKITFTPKKED